MKRFCLISSAAAASLLALANVAQAEPAVLYIPTEPIDLVPSGTIGTLCENVGMGEYNPGAGCFPNLEMETTEAPYGNAETLAMDIAAALEPFDVHVTTERPPAYLPHYMLLPSDEVSKMGTSYSCAGAPIGCAGRRRNGIATTSGGTMNCMDPDQLQASLYAFGRMAGLEGSVNPMDPMHYPPDFMTPATAFQDQCDDRSQLINPETMMPSPLECTSADHNGCEMGQQNTVADLTAYFGERTDDTDPPVLSNMQPTDGQDFELPAGAAVAEVTFSVDIEDADPIVGLSIRVESDVFMPDLGRNYITGCTNNHCDFNLIAGDPFKPTDSDWAFALGLPGGSYAVTIEASDYHGNVADTISYSFTVNGGMGTETGGVTDTDSPTTGATMTGAPTTTVGMTTFLDTTDTEGGETGDGEATGMQMDDDGGCNCRSSSGAGGAFMVILGLFGFMATRRRD